MTELFSIILFMIDDFQVMLSTYIWRKSLLCVQNSPLIPTGSIFSFSHKYLSRPNWLNRKKSRKIIGPNLLQWKVRCNPWEIKLLVSIKTWIMNFLNGTFILHYHFFLAHKDVLKSRTKSMVDQVDSLRDRYENLEKRRKNEAEGYQADINLLKQKLRHVEQQLIRSAVTKTKGNFNMYLISITFNNDVTLGPSKCVCLCWCSNCIPFTALRIWGLLGLNNGSVIETCVIDAKLTIKVKDFLLIV